MPARNHGIEKWCQLKIGAAVAPKREENINPNQLINAQLEEVAEGDLVTAKETAENTPNETQHG